MASTAAPLRPRSETGPTIATPAPVRRVVSARRHLTWLLAGMAGAFLVPFLLTDVLNVQRDVYYALYVAYALGIFLGWAHDTGRSVPGMLRRRWKLAVGLSLAVAVVCVFLGLKAEDAGGHPGGVTFVGALIWRGLVYGAADGLLLSAFPILAVFAALGTSRLRRRAGGLVAVGAVALVASLAMTAVYHVGYSDFRGAKLRRPVIADVLWSVPTLATLNPIGAPIAHASLHVTAVAHNYDTNLFLPPH
jgi:hypothetical protein